MRRLAASLLLSGIALAGFPATAAGDPVRCFEDQACWDCATMGNRVCGPPPALWECSTEDGWVSLVANGTWQPTPPLPAGPCPVPATLPRTS